MRHSDIAYVLVVVHAHGEDHLLLHRHAKWGDWTLVGGHVEAGEELDWCVAAAREATEELPWRLGGDFDVERLELAVQWGPEPSRSASGEPTKYRAEYFLLRFLRDPRDLLRALPESEFRLVPVSALSGDTNLEVSTPVRLLLDRAGSVLRDVPRSWHAELSGVAVPPVRRVAQH
jgi:8-oxo-dGTP pyrophosphatase MutT (NUDIX family)